MKIAIFSDTFFPQVNGVARTLKRFTDHMSNRNIQYEIFTPEMDVAPVYPHIKQFSSLPFFLYPECRTAIVSPKRITESIQSFNPDIIHVATPYMMGLYGMHAAKKLGIPMVASYHTHFDQYLEYYKSAWLAPLLWKYMKWFHHPFEKIFVPSVETKEKLEILGFQSLSIWGRGVDCSIFQPDNAHLDLRKHYQIKEKYLLLFVGRLAPEKDIKTFMEIMDYLPQELQEKVHWLIVGDGPCYAEMRKRTTAKSNVTLTGYLNGDMLAQAYTAADLFVFPSSSETFGNVVLESLASGTPAVISNGGAVKESIIHDYTGKICMQRDKDSFIRAIMELLNNDEKRNQMSFNAREYALSQSWEHILDNLIDEFREVARNQSDLLKHA